MEHLDEELQAEVVDEDVHDSDEEIPHNLRSAASGGTREADMARHPETRQEGDGELEHEGRDMGSEGNEAKVEHLLVEDKMVENIVQHPLQNKVQATASRIAEQLEAHYLAEGWIEKIDDLRQSAFYPVFYVFEG